MISDTTLLPKEEGLATPVRSKKPRKLNFLTTVLFLVGTYLVLDYTFNGYEDKFALKFGANRKSFAEWADEYSKVYEDLAEFEKRFEIYMENHESVSKLNKIHGGRTQFDMTQFADMSSAEFKSKVLNKQLSKPFSPPESKILRSSNLAAENLPESFDWRSQGAVTPIKNQGQVGTCWAFSAVENLEGQWYLKNNKSSLVKLSTEQIVDCDGKWSGGSNQSNCGINGGLPSLAFEYVKHAGGIELEQDYSYCSGNGKCQPCSPPGFDPEDCGPAVAHCKLADSCQAKLRTSKFVPGLKVADWKQVENNATEVAAQLMKIGPLSVALNAQLLQFYFGGVFDPFDSLCNRKGLDHAVLMVGWGVDNSRIFGKREYWLIKNSWGTKWGEKGYFRILKGTDKCGITEAVTTSILA